MELSYILAKVIGIFLIVMGIASMVKYKVYHRIVARLAKSRYKMAIVSAAELLVGLLIVIAHPYWEGPLWKVIITVVGWLLVLEGLLYLFLPHRPVKRLILFCNHRRWYTWGGGASILIGLYLLLSGLFS